MFDDARQLLTVTRSRLDRLAIEADACRERWAVSPELQVLCKDITGDLQSALDYVARELADTFGEHQQRPMFPIIDPARLTADFQQHFDSALPGVRAANPSVYSAIMCAQSFSDGSDDCWLRALRALANRPKHNFFASAELRNWVHLGGGPPGNEINVFAETVSVRAGARIGGIIFTKDGDFNADSLPEAASEPGWVVEKVVDFQLIEFNWPMEWCLVDLHRRVHGLIEDIERAAAAPR